MAAGSAKGWVGIAAVVVILAAGVVIAVTQMGGRGARPGQAGDAVRVCLKDGTRFLAAARPPGAAPAPCPQCGGATVAAVVFECQAGHLFVGYLQKPPQPDAVQTDDEYLRHQPLALRPGLDEAFAPENMTKPPVCPVCRGRMKRPIVDFQGIQAKDIQMGSLPSTDEAN